MVVVGVEAYGVWMLQRDKRFIWWIFTSLSLLLSYFSKRSAFHTRTPISFLSLSHSHSFILSHRTRYHFYKVLSLVLSSLALLSRVIINSGRHKSEKWKKKKNMERKRKVLIRITDPFCLRGKAASRIDIPERNPGWKWWKWSVSLLWISWFLVSVT